MPVVPVKVCGLTNKEDALMAWGLGAAALGFVMHPSSPRAVSLARLRAIRDALPEEARCAGVFVDAPPERINEAAAAARLACVQLHGEEPPEDCAAITVPVIKVLTPEDILDEGRIRAYGASAFLLDAFLRGRPGGGTGLMADWSVARKLSVRFRLILAGGINPSNAREALRIARPWALDVSSGVERAPGVKDHALLRALFNNVNGDKGERPCLI